MITPFAKCKITGIGAAVPKRVMNNRDHLQVDPEEIEKTIQLTGIERYRKADVSICTSDLCYHAALNLFNQLDIDPFSIDAILFVSQTPDYKLPATACTLQARLGCKKESLAFDINLGCSGFIVGLYNACALISGTPIQRVLLLCGDTQTKLASPEDKSVNFIMGDAGTAILIEKSEEASPIYSALYTDGSRFEKLIIPAGGCRMPSSESTRLVSQQTDGQKRSLEHMHMSGMDIFTFSVTDVVSSIRNFMNIQNIVPEELSFLVLHQANKFMTDKISRKLGFQREQTLYSMHEYGNTSAASIPLTIVYHRDKFENKKVNCLLSGFGVGLSWGVTQLTLDNCLFTDIQEI